MSRGLTEEPEVPQQSQGDGPTNDDIMDYLDQLSLLVRDLDTRLSTLERHLLSPKTVTNNETKPFVTYTGL